MTSLSYPSGRVVNQMYDPIGRLTQMLAAGQPPYLSVASGDYTAAGQVKHALYGNGVAGDFTYNERLQLASLRYSKPSSPDLLNLAYEYGTQNNGQVQKIRSYSSPGVEDLAKTQSYEYDAWSHLKRAYTTDLTQPGTWRLEWGYDRLGNRRNQSLTGGNTAITQPQLTISETTNRITTAGYAYDTAGNMTNDSLHTYTYDAEGRMTKVDNGTTATYSYVGASRVKKVAGSTTTVYIFSGSKVIAEYVSGAVSKEYVYSGSSLLATVAAGGATTYQHPDHLSTRVETDAAGIVTRTFGQYPFGEVWYETGTANKWKFTSYERDGESGLDYAISRYDSSRLGRFMSPDPLAGSLSNPQSLNRYTYVGNDPINSIDPLGLKTIREDFLRGGGGARIYAGLLASRPGQFGSTWSEFDLLTKEVTVSTYTPAHPISTPISSARNQYGEAFSWRMIAPGAWSTIIIGTGFDLFGGGWVNSASGGGGGRDHRVGRVPPQKVEANKPQPLSRWDRFFMILGCLAGGDPDNTKPIGLSPEQPTPSDSTDSTPSTEGQVPSPNPAQGTAEGTAFAAGVVECIANIYKYWPQK